MTAWTTAVAATSPYRWFKMDETSGVTATDSSGNGGTGNYNSTGDITYAQAALIPGDSGGLSSVMNATAANLTASSVSLSRIGVSYATTFKSSTDQTGAFFRANSSTFLNIGASSSFANIAIGQTPSLSYDPTPLFDGDEHLIIYIVKATSVELWVDGTMVGSASHSATDSTLTSVTVKGSSAGPTGAYDDLILWNTSLTSTQVGDLWAAWQGGTTLALGRASETDTARTLTPQVNSFTALNRATETDLARALTAQVGIVQALGQASEADAARTLTPVEGFTGTINRASETDLARALTAVVSDLIPLGRASETDAAQTITFSGGLAVALNRATESDLARPIAAKVNVPLGRATSTETARPFARLIATDTSNRVGGRIRSGYGVATWEPPVEAPPATVAPVHDYDVAQAWPDPTVTAGRPGLEVIEAGAKRHRDRIVVGGKDITYFRGHATPTPAYRLIEPLDYGSGTLSLPQVSPAFELLGTGALRWLQKGKPVVVQRVDVDTNEVVAVDYIGFISDFSMRGNSLTCELGGVVAGRAALMDRQPVLFRQVKDVGNWVYSGVTQASGVNFTPRLGPVTGIRLASRGGTSMLDHINENIALAGRQSGASFTVGRRDDATWGMWEKDVTTIHATVYFDDARMVADLHNALAEEPNRIYGTGVTPEGQRVKNGRYPGLRQGPPPPYPMDDESAFGVGTTNEDTDTGDGISVMLAHMVTMGYLSPGANVGVFNSQVAAAVRRLQDDAGLTESGNMNTATWDALYDLTATGFSLANSHIAPMARRNYVDKWLFTASGAIAGRNPNHDPHRPKVDASKNFGAGFERQQMHQWSRDDLREANDPNWVGTLTANMAFIAGEHTPGEVIFEDDVMPARAVKNGMNIWAPLFDGGTLFHVSGVLVPEGGRAPVFTIDTRARDTMAAWECITRNRESRHNPARAWQNSNRQSEVTKDHYVEWDEISGVLDESVNLIGGQWNIVPVLAGQAGTVQKIRLRTDDPTRFAASITARPVTANRMNLLVPAPLTESGTARWDLPHVRDFLDDKGWVWGAGQFEQRAGYFPGKETGDDGEPTGDAITGVHEDDAGFGYVTFAEPVLYVAIWPVADCKLMAGRIMWNQLEAGA